MLSSIITLLFSFFVLVLLMIVHEFGHFIIAKRFNVRVDEFGIGYPPRIFGKKFGETLYSINWIPLGAFVRIYGEEDGAEGGRSFNSLKIWKKVMIVIGGVAAFWFASMVIFTVVFMIGADLPISDQDVNGLSNPKLMIVEVANNSPAKLAGFEKGDQVTSIKTDSGTFPVNKTNDFQDVINNNKGKQITITVERSHQTMQLSVMPRESAPQGQGLLGVSLERMATLIEKQPFFIAPFKGIWYTLKMTWVALLGLYNVFKNLLFGQGLPQGAELAGPLGITIFLANAFTYGPGFFLYFIGLISIFVAIFNVFPIPALDGGKLLFLLFEKVKGKPVSPQLEQKISALFFILLISLSLFVTIKFDIPRFRDFINF